MIQGRKVLLRTFRDADVAVVGELRNAAAATMPFNGQPLTTPPRLAAAYRENGFWGPRGGTLLICAPDERLLGEVEFDAPTTHTSTVSYLLYRPEDWGKGYGSEALQLLVDHLFRTRASQNRLQLTVHVENAGSIRVAEKCGFTREDVARESIFLGGKFCDQYVYTLLRRDWGR